MNYKELIVPVLLAFLITLGFNFFWGGRSGSDQLKEPRSGQSYLVPEQEQERKPLNKEIDFIDVKSSRKTELTEIETEHARYVFSNDGATLDHLEFKRSVDGKKRPLSTILPSARLNKEGRCFLVALGEKTPYYFDLISQDETDTAITLTYQATFGEGTMRKRFTIFKNSFNIDLGLTLENKAGFTGVTQARIFVPSPFVAQLAKTDVIDALVNDPGHATSVQRLKEDAQLLQRYWVAPTLFGTEEKYFIHSMVKDEHHFVKRGYFKKCGTTGLAAILEGPEITQKDSWTISFYLGPKEAAAIAAVDPRLEQTLDYGWFGFIGKFLLSFMQWINTYTHNFGWAIVLLTLLIKLLLLPFTMKGMQSLKKQQEFQKKMQYIQQRYKHDAEALNRERAELIRKHGMPGIGGCLPLLLQIPVFVALSRVLSNSIELYQAPFLWMSDLSVKDPYYILPVFAGVSMVFSMPSPDPKQRISSLVFALIIGAVVASLPAGLGIYIVLQQILTVGQNALQKRLKI